MKESKDNVFPKRWNLYALQLLKELINKGFSDYDAIG